MLGQPSIPCRSVRPKRTEFWTDSKRRTPKKAIEFVLNSCHGEYRENDSGQNANARKAKAK